MTATVRCPACRGSKKVAKLGGMIGQCNTCSGIGTILAVDKPQAVVEQVETNVDIIKAVSDAVPVSTLDMKDMPQHAHSALDVKVDGKKALYKRKVVAK